MHGQTFSHLTGSLFLAQHSWTFSRLDMIIYPHHLAYPMVYWSRRHPVHMHLPMTSFAIQSWLVRYTPPRPSLSRWKMSLESISKGLAISLPLVRTSHLCLGGRSMRKISLALPAVLVIFWPFPVSQTDHRASQDN